jgi:cytochrome c oxidase subunit 4
MSGAHGSKKIYLLVGLWLGVFTVATVLASYLHLPPAPAIALALAIASVKATLVGLYFMHLKDEVKLILGLLAITAACAVVLLTLPLLDAARHPWVQEGAIPPVTASHHEPGAHAAGPAAPAAHGHSDENPGR